MKKMSRFTNPIPQFILENGDLAAGGTLSLYESGTNVLLSIYADVNESTPIANPVTLGSRGEVPNIFYSLSARAVVADASGNQIFDVDPVGGTTASGAYQIWDSNVVYGVNDIVFGSNSEPYISLTNQNEGNDPTLDAGNNEFWTELLEIKYWNAQETYAANSLTFEDGAIYRSTITSNSGNQPSTDGANNWVSIADASVVVYDNISSGLLAVTGQAAIDEIVALINNLPSSVVYRGQLDVSAGNSALPATPQNGDLYVIAVSGTITVSTAGATPVSTVVNIGEQIIYNGDDTQWDLIAAVQQASSVSYNNAASGLAATNVQNAIDEVEGRVDTAETNIANNDNDISTNAGNITTNANNIGTLTTSVATNADNISTNAGNIATNTSNIATNTGVISSLGTAATADVTTSATDTTAGRVTKVGDFGLGAAVTPLESTDLNSIPVSGFYGLNTSAVANKPTGMSGASTLLQINYDSNDKMQMAFNRNGSTQWIRNEIGGTWTSWVEILTDNNTGTVVTSDITTTSIDSTAGRVTKVGDFGIGVDSLSQAYTNWLLVPWSIGGKYAIYDTAINRPAGIVANFYVIEVIGYYAGIALIRPASTTLGKMYNVRVDNALTAPTFTVIQEILTESSIINAETLDNLDSTQFLRSDISDQMNGQLSGGFGAITTSGTLDWDDVTNARSGNGTTLLRGTTSVNGPDTSAGFYHPFSFEYVSKNGSGNMTQYAIPYQDGLDMYFRVRINNVWGAWRTILTDYNLPTYAVPNKNQNNWATTPSVISSTVGMLGWKNFGNGHVIFDASQSTSPTGSTVNNTNSNYNWISSYPTLMGWNGADTYGVRVDSARNADNLGTITASQFLRSDVNDVVTGNITFNDNRALRFGTGNDAQFFCTGSHMYTDLKSGIGNWYIRDGTTTRFTFDDDGTFTATNKIKVNALEVDTPKTYLNASTQTITRQGVSTYINKWTGGNATYTLNESTFITGDKVYVTKVWDNVGTLTIASGQVIYLSNASSALSQTLSVVGTVCFEYIGYAWLTRAA